MIQVKCTFLFYFSQRSKNKHHMGVYFSQSSNLQKGQYFVCFFYNILILSNRIAPK
jgi:hypothetical protein